MTFGGKLNEKQMRIEILEERERVLASEKSELQSLANDQETRIGTLEKELTLA